MPDPQPGESRRDFIRRCIPIVIEEGTAADGSQANAVCNSMYEQSKTDEFVPDHERDLSGELRQLAEELEAEGIDSFESAEGFTGVMDSTTPTDLADLEAELRAVEVPEHMRKPSLMQTEDDLLQEP